MSLAAGASLGAPEALARRSRAKIMFAAAAVVACAAAAAVLVVQLNRTRLTLQADGVLEFNFVQQLDHDFDVLAHALADRLLAAERNAPDAELRRLDRAWHTRFDVLYSAAVTIDSSWAGTLLHDAATPATLARARRYIDAVDARLVSNEADARTPEGRDWRYRAMLEARELSREVYDIGLAMFLTKAGLRDDVSHRMDWLTRALWFFGASLLAAAAALGLLLRRSTQRTMVLFEEARSAQQQLESALSELTDGDLARKGQNRFLASATHDLRQPLQALQYYLAALYPHVGSERGLEIVSQVVRSTDAAQRLLTELLDISKLDAGVLEARRSPTDLDALLERLHDELRPEAEARGLRLSVTLPGVWVDTDGSLLERILRNLLANALAYTREGGVTLDARPVPASSPALRDAGAHGGTDRVVVSVSDTGIGIPPAEREAIFDEYYRLDAPGRNPDRGIGLGLAIVRRLARLLDIPMHIESEVGRGTRFELTLPRTAGSVAARAASAPGARIDRSHGADAVAGLVVLVVDDERDVREGIVALLEQQGCTVLAAASVEESLARLVESELVPDLIVADYRLQHGRTGVEAIERVREEVNEDVPALVVTGDTSPDRLREAAASGLPLLHKPVDATRLFEAMARTTGLAA